MIFVDTGAWIAVTDASDQYHRQAVKMYALLKKQRKRFVTTDYVIDETVTRLRYDAGHPSALRYLDLLAQAQGKGTLRIVYNTEAIFQEAITVFRRYDTIDASLTDCVSFVVCQQLEIPYAFSFDKHFPIMGIALYALPNY
jgi:hypothetical protein